MLLVITIEKTFTNNNWLKANCTNETVLAISDYLTSFTCFNKFVYIKTSLHSIFTCVDLKFKCCQMFCQYKQPWKLKKLQKLIHVFEANPRKFGNAKIFQNTVCFHEEIRKQYIPYLPYVFGQTGLSKQ